MTVSTQAFASGAKLPIVTPVPAPTPIPVTQPVKTPVSAVVASGKVIDQISAMAAASSCASYSWKNRGRAPALIK